MIIKQGQYKKYRICKKLLSLALEIRTPMKVEITSEPQIFVRAVENIMKRLRGESFELHVKAVILLNNVEIGEFEYKAAYIRRTVVDFDVNYVRQKLEDISNEFEATNPTCHSTTKKTSVRCGLNVGVFETFAAYINDEDIEALEKLIEEISINDEIMND
ncbi:MAG: hypothetical protein QXT13_07645 [Pyrobaculum sp.]